MSNIEPFIMRPLEDLGYVGYWLSICGRLYSDHDDNWMTPIRPKRSVEITNDLGVKVRQELFHAEGREPNVVKTIRLFYAKADGSKERMQVSIPKLYVQVLPNAFGVPLAGFAIHFFDERKCNTALSNLWYGADRPGVHRRLAWDGRTISDHLSTDRDYRAQLKFELRQVLSPPQG